MCYVPRSHLLGQSVRLDKANSLRVPACTFAGREGRCLFVLCSQTAASAYVKNYCGLTRLAYFQKERAKMHVEEIQIEKDRMALLARPVPSKGDGAHSFL